MALDISNAVVTLANELQTGVGPLIGYLATFTGVIMIIVSLNHFVKASEAHGQQHDMAGAWWGLLIGTLLLSFKYTVELIAASFGNFGGSSLSYGGGTSSIPMIKGALVIVQTLGLIVILKSLHVFHKISKGQQSQHTTQQAIGWLIFGGAAFQAQNTILMLASSVGMQSEVSALIK